MTKMDLHSDEFLRTIMVRQLRLSAGIASVFIVIIAGVPVLNVALPEVMNAPFAFGLTLTWFLLGLAIFPLLIVLAWVYVRRSNAFEDEVVGMVDPATLPASNPQHETSEPQTAPVAGH